MRSKHYIVLAVIVVLTGVFIGVMLSAPVPVDDEALEDLVDDAQPAPETRELRQERAATRVAEPPPRTGQAVAVTGVLTGTIRSTTGEPIAAEIVVVGADLESPRTYRSGSDGRFSIRDLPTTPIALAVRAAGFRPLAVAELVVRGKVHRELQLEPISGIAGLVLAPDGRPARGAFVRFEHGGGQRTVQADAQGRFSWDRPGMDLATVTVIAYTPWHASSERTAPTGKGDLTLRLGEGATISGRVVDSSGEHVAGASVGIDRCAGQPDHSFEKRWWPPVRTDAEGRFTIARARPGRCDLSADAERYAPGTVAGVWTTPGTTTDGVTITLSSGGVVRGRVTDRGTNQPVAGAQVVLFEPGSHLPPSRAATDAQGQYRLHGIAPGPHSVRIEHPKYLTELRGGVDVPEAGEVVRDMTLRPRKPGERFAFQGIGATLARNSSGVIIRDTLPNSPAAAAGLKAGDVIVGVDHVPTTSMGISTVVERIRGEAGAPVVIEVDRPGSGRVSITVERDDVVVKDRDSPHPPMPPQKTGK